MRQEKELTRNILFNASETGYGVSNLVSDGSKHMMEFVIPLSIQEKKG